MKKNHQIKCGDESHELQQDNAKSEPFVLVPISVLMLLQSKELTPFEVLFLSLIQGFTTKGNKQACFASNKYFANFLGCGERYIEKTLSKLKELDLIETNFVGRKRFISIKSRPNYGSGDEPTCGSGSDRPMGRTYK